MNDNLKGKLADAVGFILISIGVILLFVSVIPFIGQMVYPRELDRITVAAIYLPQIFGGWLCLWLARRIMVPTRKSGLNFRKKK
jgi:uncharacterized membrane protein